MKIEVESRMFTERLLRENPHKIFVFGDNMKRYGKRGQAVIRDEPNAYGVATKRYPSMDNWAFFLSCKPVDKHKQNHNSHLTKYLGKTS